MALILARREGEEIALFLEPDYTQRDLDELVEKGLRVRLAMVDGGRARLAVEAPESVAIVRSELLQQG